jgi:hypothetical protein
MPDYKLYHLDPHSGHITKAEERVAADDDAALVDARERRSDHPLELWCGRRKVGRVDVIPEGAAFVPDDPTA